MGSNQEKQHSLNLLVLVYSAMIGQSYFSFPRHCAMTDSVIIFNVRTNFADLSYITAIVARNAGNTG